MSNNIKEQNEEIKKLVIERLEIMPRGTKISIGSSGEFTKEQLKEHVLNGDEIGQKITEIQISYLQALKEGVFYAENFTNNQTKA